MPLNLCWFSASNGVVSVTHGEASSFACWGIKRAVVIGVCWAEDDALAPGDGEEDSTCIGHDDGVGHRQARAVDDEMDALGDAKLGAAGGEAGGPGAGGIDDA